MKELSQIRFVTTNFYNLQGLRVIPLGGLLLFVCLWANGSQGVARNFLVPAIGSVCALGLLFIIDRFYAKFFGRVQRTTESRQLEWMVSVVGSFVALGAFYMDITLKLPVSLLGLVFAAGLVIDYIRITWLVKGRSLLYYPVGAILIAVVSLLPLLGISNWWNVFGLANQMLGLCMAIGIFTILTGVCGHIFLARTLPSRVENKV
jgi:hypothetical protein